MSKPGFHDNSDLQGQDATYLTPDWLNAVQEELSNAIEGFGEVLNTAQNNQLYTVLSNLFGQISTQISNLSDQVDSLETDLGALEDYAIGDLYFTTRNFTNAAAVAAHKGYGSWEAYGDGQALIALASSGNTDAPSFMKSIGGVGGTYDHTLTVEQLPNFNLKNGILDHAEGSSEHHIGGHIYGYTQDDCPGLAAGKTETALGASNGWQGYTSSIGDDEPFSLVQRSIAIAVWRRVS